MPCPYIPGRRPNNFSPPSPNFVPWVSSFEKGKLRVEKLRIPRSSLPGEFFDRGSSPDSTCGEHRRTIAKNVRG